MTNIIPYNDNDVNMIQLIDSLVDQLDKSDMPEKVVKATELLLAGYPTYDVARKVGVSATTIKTWISKYPAMAQILSSGKQELTRFRMLKLEQQFIDAVQKSSEILNLDLSGETVDDKIVDPKILTVVAAQSRYIIGLFAGQKSDVTVTHEIGDTVLQAKSDALDYIAEQINDSEIIETVVRVVDESKDTEGPLYAPDGNPTFGEAGVLETTDNGTVCGICGSTYKAFAKHILTKHDMSTKEYEIAYALEDGIIRRVDTNYRLERKKKNAAKARSNS